ncbi:hypothetical protein M407DRAFT_227672, partial [Tulasnella calospora MUT 4182]
RFWFSPDPHIYRHVRGWFRLISELRKSDVNVICVFDGRTRSGAKSREIRRRESARKLLGARAQMEASRLRRLERILSIEERYQEIGECQEGATAEVFQDQLQIQDLSRRKRSTKALSPASHFKRLAVLYRDYQRNTRPDVLTTVVSTCSVDTIPDSASDKRGSVFEDKGPRESRQPLPHVVSTSTEIPEMFTNVVPGTDDEAVTISKLQAQLAAEEGRIWASILRSISSTTSEQKDDFNKTIQDLRKLLLDSQNLLESYSKRHNPPSSLTYDESRIILNAMRVPVVEAPYPYEAEGVAASLCINGLADFVASEDTDVLVYGATMLRNITTRDEPLIRISGEDVRNALNLTPKSYIDLALLFGSDFTERLRGLGPIRATKLIQTFGSIEEILRSERSKEGKGRRYLPEPRLSEKEYMSQIKDGRTVFSSLPPIPNEWEGLFAQTRELELDDANIAEIMRGFDLSSEYAKAVEEKVNPLEVDYYGGFESGFHSFGPGPNQTSIYL